jgi:hypothetical protein
MTSQAFTGVAFSDLGLMETRRTGEMFLAAVALVFHVIDAERRF